TMQSLQLPFTF
nr:immunoglobulin light chain junction region [Macaca mulatta]